MDDLALMEHSLSFLDEPARTRAKEQLDSVVQAGGTDRAGLIDLVRHHADGDVVATACWLLARLEVKAAEPALTDLLFGHRPFAARAQAGISLGQIGDGSTAIRLIEFVLREPDRSLGSGEDEQLRRIAVNALGHLGNPDAIPTLVGILEDRHQPPALRGEAAEALGNLGAREAPAVNALVASLGDAEPEVRFFSAFALGRIGDGTGLPALRQVAASDDAIAGRWGSVADEARSAISEIEARGVRRWP